MGIIRLILALSVVIAHSTPLFGQTGGGKLQLNYFLLFRGFIWP